MCLIHLCCTQPLIKGHSTVFGPWKLKYKCKNSVQSNVSFERKQFEFSDYLKNRNQKSFFNVNLTH